MTPPGPPATVLRAGAATDTGLVRANNQDTLLVAGGLFAVADGMGGHAAGEVASDTAVRALEAAWEAAADHDPAALASAAQVANRRVWETAQADPDLRGMGTTLVAVALTGAGRELAVVSVGDSRVYLLRAGELAQLTVDHSLVAELVAEGQLAAEQAEYHPQRHVLTRALGVDADVHVDLLTVTPAPGDRLLLCSDGLIREVDDGRVASTLRRLADPQEAAKELVADARARGGSDNITVVVVDVVGDDATIVAGTQTGGDATTALPRPAAATPVPPAPTPRRGRVSADARPRARLITGRVAAFIALLLIVAAAGAAGVAWYARGGYYVGVGGSQITIYQGRPGGVLWINPTVAERTGVSTSAVEARHLPELASGVTEPSLGAARAYVDNLTGEFAQARRPVAPPVTITPGVTIAPAPPPTVIPPAGNPPTTAKGTTP